MSANSLFLELFMPLHTEVERIFDTLREVRHQKGEDIPFIKTRAFNEKYSAFRIEMKRRGKDFSVNSFYSSLLKELDTFEKVVIRMEKDLQANGESVQTHQLLPRIQVVRDHILDLQSTASVKNSTTPKNSSVIENRGPDGKEVHGHDKELQANSKVNNRTGPKRRIVTFKWRKDSLKKEDFRKVVCAEFLGKKTAPKDFEKVFFEGVEVKSDLKPLTWKSDNATELKLFILELIENEIIEAPFNKYISLTSCFVRPNGDRFQNKFKNLKVGPDSNIGRQTSEKVQALIEKFK